MERKATALWRKGLKDGKGWITTESGALKKKPYSFASRFEAETATNPEELLAAAHAACFSMALVAQLEKEKIVPASVETSATVTLEKVGEQLTITKSQLKTVAKIPGVAKAIFDKAVEAAKAGCLVSRLFKAETPLEATLES
jgi:osmotically inducible protein OsmC